VLAPLTAANGGRGIEVPSHKPIALWRRSAHILLASLFAFLYLYAAWQHASHVNLNLESNDQLAYLIYAQGLYYEGLAYPGDHNRMPLFPALLTPLYQPGIDEATFFARAKMANILLSVVLWGALWAFWSHRLGFEVALNLAVCSAFTMFCFKAAYVQAEIVYYAISFGAFVLLIRALLKPNWKNGFGAGLFLGLWQLTKASALPALVGYFLLSLSLCCWEFLRPQQRANDSIIETPKWIRRLVTTTLVLGTFLMINLPYFLQTRSLFGTWMYNVNSTLYMWCDSWQEVKMGPRGHGDRVAWPNMSPDQLPSIRKYLREHTISEIVGRIWDGLRTIHVRSSQAYGFYRYVWVYGALAIGAGLSFPRRTWRWLRPRLHGAIFALGFLATYLTLYAWYCPIACGNRFVLGLYLPWLYTTATSMISALPPRLRIGQGRIRLVSLINTALFLALCLETYWTAAVRVLTMKAGN